MKIITQTNTSTFMRFSYSEQLKWNWKEMKDFVFSNSHFGTFAWISHNKVLSYKYFNMNWSLVVFWNLKWWIPQWPVLWYSRTLHYQGKNGMDLNTLHHLWDKGENLNSFWIKLWVFWLLFLFYKWHFLWCRETSIL